jgi:DNA-binding NarL/FixJ family response regulator
MWSGQEVPPWPKRARLSTMRQMAEKLVLSEYTVWHHLEHIYEKVGVSTRVAATLFAVEHDLLQ